MDKRVAAVRSSHEYAFLRRLSVTRLANITQAGVDVDFQNAQACALVDVARSSAFNALVLFCLRGNCDASAAVCIAWRAVRE